MRISIKTNNIIFLNQYNMHTTHFIICFVNINIYLLLSLYKIHFFFLYIECKTNNFIVYAFQ